MISMSTLSLCEAVLKAELRNTFKGRWKRCHDGSDFSCRYRAHDVNLVRALAQAMREIRNVQSSIG